MKTKILVTGGAGFIGSEFVRQAVAKKYRVAVVDKLTYAGDLARLKEVEGRYAFYRADICDKTEMEAIIKKEKPQAIINFAAESHVDRSIQDATAFIETNIKGAHVLLDTCRQGRIKRFIQLSTDEVYGEIKKGAFAEDSPLVPNSPYAASKAAADLLIKSYVRTHKVPAIIVRPCNNYGPWQYPEKLIPLSILKIMRNETIPLYGNGKNVREWLFVKDCAAALFRVMEKGMPGQTYNMGSGEEKKNIDLIKQLLKIFGKSAKPIRFIKDRPGHDWRYRLATAKIEKELCWSSATNLEAGLRQTVSWSSRHASWLAAKGKRSC